MSLNTIPASMTTGLLKTNNRLSELAGNLSTAYTNIKLNETLPVGLILPFAGGTTPSGWLLCFGQAVSRTNYAALYAVIGEQYGAGDGTTTFNVPDLRGRVAAGRDNMGGTAASRLSTGVLGQSPNSLGNSGGTESHTTQSATLSGSGTTVATSTSNIQPSIILNYIIKSDLVIEAVP